MMSIPCGHSDKVVTRTYNVGDGHKSKFDLCSNCKSLKCFCEFILSESPFTRHESKPIVRRSSK